MRERSSLQTLVLLVSFATYVTVLHVAYRDFIAPQFGYLAFTYRSPHWASYLLVVLLATTLVLLMPRRLDRPSSVVLWLHFALATAPSMLVPQYEAAISASRALGFALFVGVAWLAVVLLTAERVRPTFRLSVRLPCSRGIWPLLAVAAGLFLSYLIVGLRLSPRFVGLGDVVDLRLSYRHVLTTASPLVPYALILTTNVINPALMVFGLTARRWWPMLAGAAGQLVIFSVTGYKKALLSIPIVVVVTWLWRRGRVGSGAILGGFAVAMVLSSLALWLFEIRRPALLLLMRMLAVPGNLSSAYASIFWDLPDLRWSYSFLSWMFDYPYPENPSFLVGSMFRGDEQISSNVNLFGDGFMNWSWAGVAVECLALVVLLWFLDNAGRGLPAPVPAALCIVPTFALANSSIFTSLVSHGFLALVAFLAVLPRSGWGAGDDPAPHQPPGGIAQGERDAEDPDGRERRGTEDCGTGDAARHERETAGVPR
jgi:hypothetical protein